MKTQYYTATSLDGFIADPDHSLEWLFQFGAIEDTSYPRFIAEVGALAMGRSTYEWLLRHEIHPGTPEEKPWPYTMPTWVFSHHALPAVPGADVRFVQGDVRPAHRAMVEAAAGRNVWLVGGGDLVGQFHDHGLLDEVWVQVASVTLGAGMPLLPRRVVTPPMRLVSAQARAGFAELVFEVRRASV